MEKRASILTLSGGGFKKTRFSPIHSFLMVKNTPKLPSHGI
jgi:hypothetical protein